ncbi:MAG: EF-hand domain-containing protein [Sphingomonadales bacterium]|nr:EF-hand domain-containing protein [Sphingomonadales bacterium]
MPDAAANQPADAAPAGPAAPQAAQQQAQPGANVSTEQAQANPAQSSSTGTQVASFVDQQFPTVDTDADGALTQTEFEGWISKLKTAELQSSGKPVDAAEVRTYAQNAFLTADKDADKKVTKAEVAQFFGQA